MRLLLKVVPKASRARVVGWLGNRLKISVTEPPERGKANAEVVKLLAKALGVEPRRIRLVGGERSPLKTVEIDGGEELLRRLPPR